MDKRSTAAAPPPLPLPPPLLEAPALHGRVVEARGVIARVVGASLRIGERFGSSGRIRAKSRQAK